MIAERPRRPLHAFRDYVRDLRAYGGTSLWKAAALVLSAALLEGVGVALLVPLIAIFAESGDGPSQLAQTAIGWLRSMSATDRAEQMLLILGVFLTLLVARTILAAMRDIVLAEIGTGYVDHWRRRIFKAISRADWLAVARFRRTDLEHAATRDVARLDSGNSQLFQAATLAALAFAQLALVFVLSPLLLLALMGMLALVALAVSPLARRASRFGASETEAGRSVHHVLGDFFASQRLARLHDAQEEFGKQFGMAIETARRNEILYAASQVRVRGIFQLAAGIVAAGTMALGLLVFATPVEILAVLLLVLARLVQPMQAILQAVQSTAHMLPAFAELQVIEGTLREQAEPAEQHSYPAGARPQGSANVRISELHFAYPDGPSVLRGLSFDIAAGECVALSGPSGAGKTTLLEIMAGLLPAGSGTITVDGLHLTTPQDFASWRARMAFVPQNPFLFDATIEENLLWGAPRAQSGMLAAALQTAQADSVVARLPKGLQTRVGERGEALSGGERQRLCLARALLRQPDMLVLDEATNALDEETEGRLLRALTAEARPWTILMVTHRQSALQYADRILTLPSR